MIRLEHTNVSGIEAATRGMRNPLNSHHKADSFKCKVYDMHGKGTDLCMCCANVLCDCYVLGENDLDLAKRLCSAGSDHRKFMRQIFVSVDITAPLYWWKEYDTYKVGTTANSTSTMHTIHKDELTRDHFSFDDSDMTDEEISVLVAMWEDMRKSYVDKKDKKAWRTLIQCLPCAFNQTRTCTMTYENLRSMYHARKNHKLTEWHTFCAWVEHLPYAKELIIE